MALTPAFYLADFMTGAMLGPVLPLESVTLSSSLEPGRFTASLDMRKAAGSFKEARALLDLMSAGKTTLVPVLEGLSNGHANPATSRALGEWWIADVERTYSDPVVKLGGPEFAGYFKDLLVTQTWQGSFSAWALVRDMIREATRTNQTIQLSTGTGSGGPTVEVDIEKSAIDYWAAIEGARGDLFEWRVGTSLLLDGVAPVSIRRSLDLGAPVIENLRLGIVLEMTTPGTSPATLLDMTIGESEHASASTVYGFGAGSGVDQVSAWTSRSRPHGEPGKSKVITVRDALKYDVLKRATAQALQRATPDDKVFRAVMPTDRYTLTVGEVVTWMREPSWSMPEAESGQVRVAGWSWSTPKPGGQDVYVLDLVRR